MAHEDTHDRHDGDSLLLGFPFPSFAGVGAALRATFDLYKDNFAFIVKVVLITGFPSLLMQTLLPGILMSGDSAASSSTIIGFWLVNFLALVLQQGALTFGIVVRLRTGATPPLAEAFRWSLKKLWVVFASSLLAAMLFGLGALLLVIPGVIVFLTYSLVVPVAIIEGTGVTESLARSHTLTDGYRLRILGTLFVFWIVATAVPYLTTGSLDTSDAGSLVLVSLIFGITNALLQALGELLALAIYLGIRAERQQTEAGYVTPTLYAAPHHASTYDADR